MSTILTACAISLLFGPPLTTFEPDWSDKLTFTHATLKDGKRPDKWGVNFGEWKVADGMVIAKQLEKDNHAAASRWNIPLQDGGVTLEVKLDGAKAFHVGFDPARGQLKKKGHLFSLVLTPKTALLMLHKDKADPKSKNVTLATGPVPKSEDGWYSVAVHMQGEKIEAIVTAPYDAPGATRLSASHPEVKVKKPGVVFRVVGEQVLMKNITVSHEKADSEAAQKTKRSLKSELKSEPKSEPKSGPKAAANK